MIKFSEMIKNALSKNGLESEFVQPSDYISKKVKLIKLKKMFVYIEKKIIFPVKLWIITRSGVFTNILLIDHSDAFQVLFVNKCHKIIFCHDLFAIRAMLGEVQETKIPVRQKFDSLLNLISLRRMNHIICVSKDTQKSVARYCPNVASSVLHLTVVEHPDFTEKSFAMNSLPERYCLLPMSFHWRKNRKLGIKVWQKISEINTESSSPLELIIVGSKLQDTEINYLDHKISSSRIHVFSNVSNQDMDYLYSKSDFVIFTSNYEGFGLPIIEGNRFGKIVLHSDIPALNEIGGTVNLVLAGNHLNQNWKLILDQLMSETRKVSALKNFEEKFSFGVFSENLLLELCRICK
jgi:glycosyltransferase involved in cell wall biosynthesis